jgi:hypothetical protein
MKSPMAGFNSRRKNDETGNKSRTAETKRLRIIGVVLHAIAGAGPHEAGIAGAAECSGLSGKHQPGARCANGGTRLIEFPAGHAAQVAVA